MLEGVVQAVDLRTQRLPAAHGAEQPLLLLVADVRQVPDQRRHQRRVLSGQFAVVHTVGEQRGAVPRGDQGVEGPSPQGLRIDVRRDRETGRRGGVLRIVTVGTLAAPGAGAVLGVLVVLVHAEAAFPGCGGRAGGPGASPVRPYGGRPEL